MEGLYGSWATLCGGAVGGTTLGSTAYSKVRAGGAGGRGPGEVARLTREGRGEKGVSTPSPFQGLDVAGGLELEQRPTPCLLGRGRGRVA